MTVNKRGFTLTELLLAMAIFSMVLIITSTVFIAINRTYARGIIRKELSEAAQTLSEDITKTIRSYGAQGTIEGCTALPTGHDYSQKVGLVSYAWGGDQGGLWRGGADCANLKVLVESRFDVREFMIEPINVEDASLYRVYGVLTSGEEDSFESVSGGGVGMTLYDNPEVRCKGTAELANTHNCAVEKFNFVINGRAQL